jgi:putative transposase
MARGNERKPIFLDDADRRAFLKRLDRSHSRLGFLVYAYCLMSNHVHLAVRTGSQPLSRVFLTLLSAYAGDFNRRYRRVGHLFQGRYKSSRVHADGHLLAVVRYIHRNPVDAGIVTRTSDYPWSSDRFYRGGGGPAWLDLETVKGIFSQDAAAAARLYSQIIDSETSAERDASDFAEAVRAKHHGSRPVASAGGRNSSVELFARAVCRAVGEPLARVRSASRERPLSRARALTALLARECAGIPLSRTAGYFGRDESTVARTALAIQAQRAEDNELETLFQRIRAQLTRDKQCTVDP